MLRLGAAFALATFLAFASTATVTAQAAGNPLVARGVAEYEDLRFDEALQTLSAALVRSGNTSAQLSEIYRYLALTYLALEREEEAAGAWRSMLAIEPGYQAGSDLSPRFRQFFDQVRAQWEADGRPGQPPPAPVTIQHRSPPQALRDEEVRLSATVDDPGGRVAQLVLAYRQGTSAVFRRIVTEPSEGELVAIIPSSDVAPPLVEYYFEALDANGLPVASRGDVSAPLRIAVPAPSSDVTSEGWFWGVVIGGGVLAVAAIAVGVFFGTQATDGEQQGTLRIRISE